MLQLTITTDYELIYNLMTNPVLFKSSMPDEDRELLVTGKWHPNHHNKWKFLLVTLDNKNIGVVRFGQFTNTTTDIHPHILPQYWGTKITDKIHNPLFKWLEENTGYCKALIMTPKSLTHIAKAAYRNGFAVDGIIPGGVYWDGRLQDIVIMSKFIRSMR